MFISLCGKSSPKFSVNSLNNLYDIYITFYNLESNIFSKIIIIKVNLQKVIIKNIFARKLKKYLTNTHILLHYN